VFLESFGFCCVWIEFLLKLVPPRFAELGGGEVIKLHLNGYKLQRFPEEANSLLRLQCLQLQHNELNLLPDNITMLGSLTELSLSHNPLVIVPPVIAQITGLRMLRLDNTLLEEFPASLGKLRHLRALSVVQNSISSLPEEIGGLRSLTKLNFDTNNISQIPEAALGALSNLVELSFTRNQLGWIPKTIGTLIWLEELRVGFNRLVNLPGEIGGLTSLVRLRVGHNLLESLPLELGLVGNLEELSFDANLISIIPIVLGKLERLRHINFDANPVKSPREDVLKQGGESLILYLRRLYASALSCGLEMSHSGLRNFPLEACTIPSLHSLRLDDNELESLPAVLASLTCLTFLSVQRNRLRDVAPECGALSSLASLLLNDNCLSRIPLSLGRARGLLELNLECNAEWITPPAQVVAQGFNVAINYLHHFGEAFRNGGRLNLDSLRLSEMPLDPYGFEGLFPPFDAPALVLLSLAKNRITRLPDDLYKLGTSLAELVLDDNELEDLPAALARLPSLSRLSICRNFLQFVPKSIFGCTALESLDIAGNPVLQLDIGLGNLSRLVHLGLDTDQIEMPPTEVVLQVRQGLELP
jgi:leucine-rich repeat protein SHOC2